MQADVAETAGAARVAHARRRNDAERVLHVDIEIAQRDVVIDVVGGDDHRRARTQAKHEVDGRDMRVAVARRQRAQRVLARVA
jgi:hypothetical protein